MWLRNSPRLSTSNLFRLTVRGLSEDSTDFGPEVFRGVSEVSPKVRMFKGVFYQGPSGFGLQGHSVGHFFGHAPVFGDTVSECPGHCTILMDMITSENARGPSHTKIQNTVPFEIAVFTTAMVFLYPY